MRIQKQISITVGVIGLCTLGALVGCNANQVITTSSAKIAAKASHNQNIIAPIAAVTAPAIEGYWYETQSGSTSPAIAAEPNSPEDPEVLFLSGGKKSEFVGYADNAPSPVAVGTYTVDANDSTQYDYSWPAPQTTPSPSPSPSASPVANMSEPSLSLPSDSLQETWSLNSTGTILTVNGTYVSGSDGKKTVYQKTYQKLADITQAQAAAIPLPYNKTQPNAFVTKWCNPAPAAPTSSVATQSPGSAPAPAPVPSAAPSPSPADRATVNIIEDAVISSLPQQGFKDLNAFRESVVVNRSLDNYDNCTATEDYLERGVAMTEGLAQEFPHEDASNALEIDKDLTSYAPLASLQIHTLTLSPKGGNSSQDMSALSMPHLQSLTLRGFTLASTGYQFIRSQFPNLNTLVLDQCDTTALLIGPMVQHVTLTGKDISPDIIKSFAEKGTDNLSTLDLTMNPLPSFTPLANRHHLLTITLHGASASDVAKVQAQVSKSVTVQAAD